MSCIKCIVIDNMECDGVRCMEGLGSVGLV